MAKRRFSAAQLRAQRDFARRFGGKRSSRRKSAPRRKTRRVLAAGKPKMARTRRALSRARRYAGRARSFGGRQKPLIDGALTGIAVPFANGFSPTYGTPAALLGIGMFRKNDTLTTLGAFSLASRLVGGSGIPGTAMAPSGGYL